MSLGRDLRSQSITAARGRDLRPRCEKKKLKCPNGVASRYCKVGSVMMCLSMPFGCFGPCAPCRATLRLASPRPAAPVVRPIPTRSVSCTAERTRGRRAVTCACASFSGPGGGLVRRRAEAGWGAAAVAMAVAMAMAAICGQPRGKLEYDGG